MGALTGLEPLVRSKDTPLERRRLDRLNGLLGADATLSRFLPDAVAGGLEARFATAYADARGPGSPDLTRLGTECGPRSPPYP